MRYVELRRHTDNGGDALTPDGISAAEAAGQGDQPIIEAGGLRSSVEDRWRDVARSAGKGADLEAMQVVDPELVERGTRCGDSPSSPTSLKRRAVPQDPSAVHPAVNAGRKRELTPLRRAGSMSRRKTPARGRAWSWRDGA